MSGGVDSSVAAALMVEDGWDVVGITLRLADDPDTDGDRNARTCCAPDDVLDVRRVAGRLGIPCYVSNHRTQFEAEVIDPFARAYAAGKTPNPCVMCNSRVKFAPLLERARGLGARVLATGHYARVKQDEDGTVRLFRGRDGAKDQSYFLYGLGQETLRTVRFPLGDLDKSEVREHARRLDLSVADKPESQEICFVGRAGYADLVEKRLGAQPGGEFVSLGGRVLGRHEGVHRFTVGQRRGLGLGGGERSYVVDIDASAGKVTVGPRSALERRRLVLDTPNWIAGVPSPDRPLTVQIRYRHPGVSGRVRSVGPEGCQVDLDEPVHGASPGQAIVLYDGDEVVGGGTLVRAEA